MEVRQRGLIAGLLTAALLVAPLTAEAKRAGGGKSHGMQRSAAPTQSYQQPRQAAPAGSSRWCCNSAKIWPRRR